MKSADHKIHILVVDDSHDAADAVVDYLLTWNYDALAAYSAEQALEMAATRKPDCVLLDLIMPGMDGVELARRLRRSFGGEITLVAITGEDATSFQYQQVISTVDHYLQKPVDAAALRSILRHADE